MNTCFEEELRRRKKLIYTCVGTSMMPMLRQHRDLLVIEPAVKEPKKYDVVLYKRDTGQYVLHRIIKAREHRYVICGDNRWYREHGITDRQILGILTAFVRDGREISVTNRWYRAYVHLWCDFFWLRAAILWCIHGITLPCRLMRKWRRSQRYVLGKNK